MDTLSYLCKNRGRMLLSAVTAAFFSLVIFNDDVVVGFLQDLSYGEIMS